MPGAVIEAMALEAPVVASDIPQVREVVSPDTALLVPVGSSTAVARAILAVMQDESAARQRAYRARAQFLDRFTIDGVVAQMCRFYERALAS
jgi:glycosyltransferase involved in cell wall biosynthesis